MSSHSTTTETTKPPEEVKDIIASTQDSSASTAIVEDEASWLLKNQLIESLQVNRTQRRKYARYTFWLTCGWITLVLMIVAASGLELPGKFGIKGNLLKLSDTVIVTLITTTTVNVFAFFVLVMKYLFNSEELKEMKDIFIRK